MAKTKHDILRGASEIVRYDSAGIPLFIKTAALSEYPGMRALCHWHDDLEFIRIRKGEMYYRVGSQTILLREGDCLLVNSRQIHYGCSSDRRECCFVCILIHPQLLTSSPTLYDRYIRPFVENEQIGFIYLSSGAGDPQTDSAGAAEEAGSLLEQIAHLKEDGSTGYELQILGVMHILMGRLISRGLLSPESSPDSDFARPDPDSTAQKAMVSYIYQNYSGKITLDDIAAAGHVSRSKCCRIFHDYLRQSPVDFLNRYRLEISRRLLGESGLSVTDTATACGFGHLSYFSKLFRECFGCTPKEYRKRSQSPTD